MNDHDPAIANALAALERRRDEIEQAIKALQLVMGTTEPQTAPSAVAGEGVYVPGRVRQSGAAGAAGVLRVLEAHPGQGFTPEALAEAMIANGWDASGADVPVRAVRAAGNRLRDKDSRVKLENGKFVLRPEAALVAAHNEALARIEAVGGGDLQNR